MYIASTGEGLLAAMSSASNTHKEGHIPFAPGIPGPIIASATAFDPLHYSRIHVSGTTTITSIVLTLLPIGTLLVLVFDGALTLTNTGTLKLKDDFVTTGSGTEVIGLYYDGTNLIEVFRSE